jgi:hypothetical protein
MPRRWARVWFGLTALLVLAGIIIQQLVIGAVAGGPASTAVRAANVVSYFSIESDILVGVVSLLLALDPDRSSLIFRVFRFSGLVAIITTGVVYHALFGDLVHFSSWGLVGDQILHTVVPVLVVVGWLRYGPRGLASWRVAALSFLYPLGWLALTGIRGALTGWYPYPFIDPGRLGYGPALLNVALLSLLMVLVVAAATVIDQCLTRRSRAGMTAGPKNAQGFEEQA